MSPPPATPAPRLPLGPLLESSADDGGALDDLRRLLERGGVLAVPTESSYGLAVDPRSSRGVEAIYRIKAREAGKPLPVVAADLEQVSSLGIDPDLPILSRLAPLWPAALSLVLPLTGPAGEGGSGPPAAAGGKTLAVRVPAHEGLRRLLAALGTPLTATSANLSGEPPVLEPAAASQLLAGEAAVVIDGGTLPGGPPSTLVRSTAGAPERGMNPAPAEVAEHTVGLEHVLGALGVEILRHGRVPAERIREALTGA